MQDKDKNIKQQKNKTYNIIKLESTCSTNNFAKKLLKTCKQAEYTCIVAEKQTAGRGQRGNIWKSEKGKNLLFSIIFYPNFIPINRQFYISKFISIAVVEVLNNIIGTFKIKWTNDIYFGNKKIGGILIENSLSGNKINSTIVGIGLNINQKKFPDTLPNPISLSQITSTDFEIYNLLNSLINKIVEKYEYLKTKKIDKLDKEYHKYLYGINENLLFEDKKGIFEGRILKTNKLGQLIIKTKSGKIKEYNFKEVKFKSLLDAK